MNKWQEREAEQYASDNGVGYAQAVAVLFPAEADAAPAVVNPAELSNEAPDAKVSVTK